MKHFTLIFIFFLPFICFGQVDVPDIEGNFAQIPEINQVLLKQDHYKSVNDSFVLFPGFPVVGSFTTFAPKAGGIICNMDSDADDEVIFGCGTKLYALNIDGSNVNGWPKNFPANYEISWAPASGDIDGDGEIEVICTAGGSAGGNLYAFEKDGSNVSGFPVTFGKFPLGASLSDLNNDGSLEIIIGKYDYPGGQMYVFEGDGSVFPGWPYDMGEYPASFAAIGDITNDGIPEIIGESRNKLWAWDTAGNVLPGWPFIMDDTSNTIINSYASPVIADIDNDQDMEIAFCAHDPGGFVYVVNHDGTLYPGWPQVMDNWIYAAPVIADLNGDNYPEIIAADQAASATPLNYLHAYDRNGSDIAGFPIGPLQGIYNQPTIANVDDDSNYEILVDANIQNGMEGYYYCYDHDGSENPEWPLTITGDSYFQQMVLGDPDHNDSLDIFGSGIDLNTGDVYIQLWKTNIPYMPEMIVNSAYLFNNQHTGLHPVYGTSSTKFVALKTENYFNIYPVPATRYLNINYQLSQLGDVQISIVDIIGQNTFKKITMLEMEKGTHYKRLDISDLAPGSYIVVFEFNQQYRITKKLVITQK